MMFGVLAWSVGVARWTKGKAGSSVAIKMFKLTMMTLTAISTIPRATSFVESRRSALQEVLASCDDARAELRYLLRQDDIGNAGGSDLLDCLLAAQKATDSWFNLIDERDTKLALDAVSKER
ncbi:hypothetical protein THAOC_29371 [Thalassiosira oceanica]|uniref:Uncharacterized protein n=1 Tax=Thalassiosira oceanica TaxID=159749 RepID=K0RGL8_THAOC|nr:hypothetical protein THAOC_29371 [Thalassiosira oceanica]|eukprot:EJK51454.1 hypothetical protein THAOC_29371 [Thalassiosira oceanica]